jgi:hypothetical protein
MIISKLGSSYFDFVKVLCDQGCTGNFLEDEYCVVCDEVVATLRRLSAFGKRSNIAASLVSYKAGVSSSKYVSHT